MEVNKQIQLSYKFHFSIEEYIQLVKTKKWEFSDFSNYCPICGGKDCPVRIGYYYRYYIDIKTYKIFLIPIIRYLCRKKGRPKLKDRTFSLLPYFLIPYNRFTIDSGMLIIGSKLVKCKSNKEIADKVCNSFDINLNFNFEERYINYWLRLFRQTLFKLIVFLESFNQDTSFLKGNKAMYNAWNYLDNFFDDSGEYNGASGFSIYSYEKQGCYKGNPQFLFGTAYQFC